MKRRYNRKGPGKTRRFGLRDYQLGNTFRAITLDSNGQIQTESSYEERNDKAQLQAMKLRRGGINARVVNGSGWTAIYVGVQTSGTKVQTAKPLGGRSWGPDVPQSMIKQLPQSAIKPVDISKTFGIKGEPVKVEVKSEVKSKEPSSALQQYEDDKANIIRVLLSQKKPTELGMGTFSSESSLIDAVKIVKEQDAVELFASVPLQDGPKALKSWLESLTKTKEIEKYSKREDVKKLALVLSNRKDPTVENLEGVELLVAYSKNKPVAFQLSDQLTSTKVLQKAQERMDKRKFPESAWKKFASNFQRNNA